MKNEKKKNKVNARISKLILQRKQAETLQHIENIESTILDNNLL